MKNRSRAATAAICLLAVAAFSRLAKGSAPDDLEVSAVIQQTLAIYKESGLAGLIALSQDCFSAQKPNLRCIQMDIAASQIDATFAAQMGVHRHPYYEPDSFFQRATPVFVGSGMSMQQANDYLASTNEAISRQISVQAKQDP